MSPEAIALVAVRASLGGLILAVQHRADGQLRATRVALHSLGELGVEEALGCLGPVRAPAPDGQK